MFFLLGSVIIGFDDNEDEDEEEEEDVGGDRDEDKEGREEEVKEDNDDEDDNDELPIFTDLSFRLTSLKLLYCSSIDIIN
jgi:hypothetical protein